MGHFEEPAHPWWEPGSFQLALLVALVSTACWGSWSNTAKAAGDRVNFAHYYTDFCIGTVLTAAVFLFSLGSGVRGEDEVDASRSIYAVAAGTVFGVANLLLTTGIALAGLSIAFPLCIGTGLVLGTVLTYLVDRRGHPELIFPGVFLALLGVLANARSYAALQRSRQGMAQNRSAEDESASPSEAPTTSATPSRILILERRQEDGVSESHFDSSEEGGGAGASGSSSRASARKNIVLCVVGGLLMGCWSPLSTASMKGETGLSPYFSFLCFTVSSMVVGVLILVAQQYGCTLIPRVGDVTSSKDYLRLPPLLHGWGLLGGFIWALGTLSNLVSGGPLGYALSYALGQTAPVVAVVWGLAWYKEFAGAPKESILLVVGMFGFFIAAIALLCLGGR